MLLNREEETLNGCDRTGVKFCMEPDCDLENRFITSITQLHEHGTHNTKYLEELDETVAEKAKKLDIKKKITDLRVIRKEVELLNKDINRLLSTLENEDKCFDETLKDYQHNLGAFLINSDERKLIQKLLLTDLSLFEDHKKTFDNRVHDIEDRLLDLNQTMPTWINVKKDTNVVIDGNLAYYDENLHSFIRYVLEKSVMIRIKLNKTTDEFWNLGYTLAEAEKTENENEKKEEKEEMSVQIHNNGVMIENENIRESTLFRMETGDIIRMKYDAVKDRVEIFNETKKINVLKMSTQNKLENDNKEFYFFCGFNHQGQQYELLEGRQEEEKDPKEGEEEEGKEQ